MSPTEYQELVTFIGRRFDGVDRRFDALHTHSTSDAMRSIAT